MPSRRAYVYAMPRDDGAIKIGHSSDLSRRLSQIRCRGINAFPAIYWLERDRSDAWSIELLAHWIARDFRLDGEWFRLQQSEARKIIDEAAERFDRGERAPKWADDPENVRHQLSFLIGRSLSKKLNSWRRDQPDYVPVSVAIRELISQALDSEDARLSRSDLTPESKTGDIPASSGSLARVAAGGNPRRQ